MTGRITGRLVAMWTKEGDPEFDEVGEEHASAGIRLDFKDEEALAEFLRSVQPFGNLTVSQPVSLVASETTEQPNSGGES